MTLTPHMNETTLVDQRDTEVTLFRVAISAFLYYPGKLSDEPGYTIDEDLAWCIAPLRSLPARQLAHTTDTIRALIIDPSADRREFIATLATLAGD
ncbi:MULTISPECIES: hypothetical protein [Microbacterium]|uniref:hypothetical protein n=1 Tax=Microbacterium TaxID=33882 RepID=UPI0003DE2747|nr:MULTISPECIES: hypothetical protein [Microbacterium]CDK01641.1 conserved hypothetical protein [Microbacterium sp. C448]